MQLGQASDVPTYQETMIARFKDEKLGTWATKEGENQGTRKELAQAIHWGRKESGKDRKKKVKDIKEHKHEVGMLSPSTIMIL